MTQEQQSNRQLGGKMIAAAWIGVLVLLGSLFYAGLEHQQNPNQRPVSAFTNGGVTEVTLQRNRAGHYVASGFINNQKVLFMLDTGATTVSIPENLAEKLQLRKGVSMLAQTANGTVTTYATKLRNIRVGKIELEDIPASINPGMSGNRVLLGMSFLKHLEFTQRGNELTLRQYP